MISIKSMTSYLAVAIIAIGVASAVSRDEFCEGGLTNLEMHMTSELEKIMEQQFDSSFECACGDVDVKDKSFVVDCSMEDVDNRDNEAFVSSERLVFKLNQDGGNYLLTETSWNWKDSGYDYDFPAEIFYLEDGAVMSCKVNGCKSCSVCEDDTIFSIAIDCSNLPEGADYTTECSEGYIGAFGNTFNFDVIEGGDEVVTVDTPLESTNTDREGFCNNLEGLESHIDTGFEGLMGAYFTSTHECICSDLAPDDTFTVDCIMEGFDGVESFMNSEQLVFGLKEMNEYILMKASWSSQAQDISSRSQEVITFEDGIITSCEPNGCAYCAICDGKTSIAVDCENIVEAFYRTSCNDGYSGAFANTFDYGVIFKAMPTQPTGPPTSPLSSIELVDPASKAVSKEEFCQDFAELETHLTKELDMIYETTFTNSFKCSCSDPGMTDDLFGKSFFVDCSMEDILQNKTFVSSERMTFKLTQDGAEYLLSETSWSWKDSSLNWESQEVFYFDGIFVTSCKANACASCTVCEDKTSIAVDCSDNEGFGYTYDCDSGYKGSLANNFKFKMILGEEVAIPSNPTSTQGKFCSSLTELEDFMGQSFEALQEQTYTTKYNCACSGLDTNDNQFSVDCKMEGSDGAKAFVSSENMVFKLNKQGEYSLSETSWGWQDSSVSWESQEVFTIDNGNLVSCEARGCVSCDICADQLSIAVNCSNLEVEDYTTDCSERNSGAFSNNFDFGVIRWDDVLPSVAVVADSSSEPTTVPTVQQPLQPSTKPVEAPVAGEPDSPPSSEPVVVPSQPVPSEGSTGSSQTISLLASLASFGLSYLLAW